MSTPAGKQPQAAPAVPQHTDLQGSASLTGGHVHARPPATGRYLALLSLGALGVVYGDIGTSPLYALRESFHGAHAVPPTPTNIYGVLSLVFWSLILVVTIKYVIFVLRADNRGEGGILVLTSLATPIRPLIASQARWLVRLGVFGAALLYGDGLITPAISVLSAVEGLTVATPLFQPYVVPLTLAILVGLFVIQSRGTGTIGRLFGPVMLVWFTVLAILGVINIWGNWGVFAAINPAYAASYFATEGIRGFLVLGTVVLVVTGGEALYADMGHFGARPIRVAWFALVLPSLLLNYFGQGALLLRSPESAPNSFYLMAPSWALIPLVVLATMATVIASQALISGAFSLTVQAQNLGFLPRSKIVHTSSTEFGQVYIPFVNWALMFGCISVVIGFRTSSNLVAAYGIAVISAMTITSVILAVVARNRWGWSPVRVALIVGAFLIIDLAFLGANIIKIPEGGWFPLAVAVVLFTLMATWKRGSALVFTREQHLELDLQQLLETLKADPPVRAPGTAVFLSSNPTGAPAALLANLEYNGVLHQQVLLTTVQSMGSPHIDDSERVEVEPLGEGLYRVAIRFGFMEEPNVPQAMATISAPGLQFDPDQVPYFVNRTRVIATKLPGMALWREKLYTRMRSNAASAADFFRLPPSRVFEIGTSVEV